MYGDGNNFAAERFREGSPSISRNCTNFTEVSLYNDYGGDIAAHYPAHLALDIGESDDEELLPLQILPNFYLHHFCCYRLTEF